MQIIENVEEAMMTMIEIDTQIYRGAPDGPNPFTGARTERELAAYRLLDELAVPYERLDHQPTATIESCRGVDAFLQIQICKNLFLCNSSKSQYYLLLMPGEKPFKTKAVSAQIGSTRLSFGDAETMEQMLSVAPGSASVLGLANDTGGRVALLVDREICGRVWFGCHPCVNTSSLKLRTADVFEKILPAVHHAPTFVEL